MGLPQLPNPTLSSDTNLGNALSTAWQVFKDGEANDIRTTPTDSNNIPRILVLLTKNAIPSGGGVNQATTETIAQLIKDGQYSGNTSDTAVNTTAFPRSISIFTVGMCHYEILQSF